MQLIEYLSARIINSYANLRNELTHREFRRTGQSSTSMFLHWSNASGPK